jgi:tetratricopeptide (TPR) repeat protein
MAQLPEELIQRLEKLKREQRFDQALQLVNGFLVQDPKNKEALYQVADIQYRMGEISNAEKPINFILQDTDHDPMGYYIKGVLEMEKTHWSVAKWYLKKALWLMEDDNPEILRCYGLCEYWSWNRDVWLHYLKKAFTAHSFDAEIILNLVELYVVEKQYKEAQKYITYFHSVAKDNRLQCFDRDVAYYTEKLSLFSSYIAGEVSSVMPSSRISLDGDDEE